MHPNTLRALRKIASKENLIVTADDDTVVARDDFDAVEVHAVGDRWIIAHYSDLHSQWQSSDMPNAQQGFCYAFAGSLDGLRKYGIRTYASPCAALRRYIEAWKH